MKIYENLTLDEERALYGVQDAEVKNCVFAGPADGESALKESGNLQVKDCRFELRYPLWHVHRARISGAEMTLSCRIMHRAGSDSLARGRAAELVCARFSGNQRAPKR